MASMIEIKLGVSPWHSSTITSPYSAPKRLMRFLAVSGDPNTTGCRYSFPPALAENIDAGLPVARYLARFCTTNSALGARHNTRLPVLAWISRANSAIISDLPAPVAASMQNGDTLARINDHAASTAACWYGLSCITSPAMKRTACRDMDQDQLSATIL